MMQHIQIFILSLVITGFISCQPGSEEKRETMEDNGELIETQEEAAKTEKKEAVASIASASGSNLTGKATFTNTGENKIKFELTVENATEGLHAVHLHEKGDCSAKDGSSAGGHWNPTNQPHGKRGAEAFHAGDIGNMQVGSDGKGRMSMTIEGWCIGGNTQCDILNKAVIVHAKEDDFTSQPSGNAGDRIGCGVIEQSASK